MTVLELKHILNNHPDHMNIGLTDLGTDDPYTGSYMLHKGDVELLPYSDDPDDNKILGKMLFITFTNKRAPGV